MARFCKVGCSSSSAGAIEHAGKCLPVLNRIVRCNETWFHLYDQETMLNLEACILSNSIKSMCSEVCRKDHVGPLFCVTIIFNHMVPLQTSVT